MKKRIVYPLATILIGLLLPLFVLADELDGIPGNPGGSGNIDDVVPVDGGVSLLLAAGVGYGIKKVRDSRKQKQDADLLTK